MIKVFNSSPSCLSLPEDEFSRVLINNQLISLMQCFSAFKKSQIPTLSVTLQQCSVSRIPLWAGTFLGGLGSKKICNCICQYPTIPERKIGVNSGTDLQRYAPTLTRIVVLATKLLKQEKNENTRLHLARGLSIFLLIGTVFAKMLDILSSAFSQFCCI